MTGRHDPIHDALLELESSAPVDSDPPRETLTERGPLRALTVALSIAAVLAALVVGSALLSRQDTGEAAPTPSIATSPIASPIGSPFETRQPTSTAASTSPSPTEPASTGWQQVSFSGGTDLEQREGFTLNGLTYDPTLGQWLTAEGYRDGTVTLDPLPVFSSADGTRWSHTGSVPLPEDFAPDGTVAESVQVGRILRLGDALYLSGEHARGVDFARSLAWRSAEGRDWIITPTDLPPEARVVASSGSSLVAMTTLFTVDGADLWSSSDGSSWTQAALPSSEAVTLEVYADEAGFIAYGATIAPSGEGATPVLWRSADGETWEPMGLPTGVGFIGEVVRFPDGRYLMSGALAPLTNEDRTVQMWVSDDGVAWTPTQSFRAAGSASAVGAASSGAIYLGVHDGFLRAWASPDGTSWQELPPAEPVPEVIRTGHVTDHVFVQSLVVTGELWLGLGQGSEDFVPDLWIGPVGR